MNRETDCCSERVRGTTKHGMMLYQSHKISTIDLSTKYINKNHKGGMLESTSCPKTLPILFKICQKRVNDGGGLRLGWEK